MSARKTASYGKAYNYSQISYPFQEFTSELNTIINKINATLNVRSNNCLINYYLDGKSRMSFHSGQTDILYKGIGVRIISVGETRTLRFRKIEDKKVIKDFDFPSGSFIYMTNEVQKLWQHAIPSSDTKTRKNEFNSHYALENLLHHKTTANTITTLYFLL